MPVATVWARRTCGLVGFLCIIEGRGKPEEIQGRVKQIKVQIEETTSDYDKEKLQERLASWVAWPSSKLVRRPRLS